MDNRQIESQDQRHPATVMCAGFCLLQDGLENLPTERYKEKSIVCAGSRLTRMKII